MSRHGMIQDRNWTEVQRRLRQMEISNRQISEASGVSLPTVNRVLNRHGFKKVRFGDVLVVRAAIQDLVPEGNRISFQEYDNQLVGADESASAA